MNALVRTTLSLTAVVLFALLALGSIFNRPPTITNDRFDDESGERIITYSDGSQSVGSVNTLNSWHGDVTKTWPEGNYDVIQYHMGQRTGWTTYYDASGGVISREYYRNGTLTTPPAEPQPRSRSLSVAENAAEAPVFTDSVARVVENTRPWFYHELAQRGVDSESLAAYLDGIQSVLATRAPRPEEFTSVFEAIVDDLGAQEQFGVAENAAEAPVFTDSVAKVLENTRPWFYHELAQRGVDSESLEAYLDGIQSGLATRAPRPEEFTSVFEAIVDDLGAQFEGVHKAYQDVAQEEGWEAQKMIKIRVASFDRVTKGAETTYGVLQESYPEYLESLQSPEGTLADIERTANELDSRIDAAGRPDPTDPAFPAEMDEKFFAAFSGMRDDDFEFGTAAAPLFAEAKTLTDRSDPVRAAAQWAYYWPIDIIELYNTQLNHYLITNPDEAAKIDAGSAGPGWERTGYTFRAASRNVETPAGYTPVCRFYTAGANSHFYAKQGPECDKLKAENPGNILSRDLWTYEGINFHAVVPANGVCPDNTQPVIRLYNNRFAERDSNHRFTIDENMVDEMVAEGWIREGVALCGAAQ